MIKAYLIRGIMQKLYYCLIGHDDKKDAPQERLDQLVKELNQMKDELHDLIIDLEEEYK